MPRSDNAHVSGDLGLAFAVYRGALKPFGPA